MVSWQDMISATGIVGVNDAQILGNSVGTQPSILVLSFFLAMPCFWFLAFSASRAPACSAGANICDKHTLLHQNDTSVVHLLPVT